MQSVKPMRATRRASSGMRLDERSATKLPRASVSFMAASSSMHRRGAQRLQAAAHLDRARQGMADDVLRKLRDLDQLLEIDAGLDAHFLQHEHEILGADV